MDDPQIPLSVCIHLFLFVMTPDDMNSAASRLCAACGLCCNGVLFFGVRLQPEDSARTLARLGLRAKSRKDGLQIPQPCPAHEGACCAIYEDRPTRCRIFKCRQLRTVEARAITEAEAMEKIRSVQNQVDHVRGLLEQAGETRTHKPLAARVAAVLSPPFASDPESVALRKSLDGAMIMLETTLVRDFRVDEDQEAVPS